MKEFSSLILDIKDMFGVDKLFNFMSGLQGWAQTELRRQGVQDLPSAMAAADCLVNYKMTSSSPKRRKARSKSRAKSWNQRPLRQVEAGVGRGLIHRPKWERERLPHKLPDHWDATSVMGHIECETAQRRRSSMQS